MVVLELWIPVMSGWGLAEAPNALADPPVRVAVAGVYGAAAETRSASAVIRLHLVKPVDPPTLAGILRRIGTAATPRCRGGVGAA